ncbi:hypothetical protein COLO4_03495 [Corchorus olitorius]|uniref:Uncharacterized protein n=1 Tax=Corchorus olitorius TaxID=93759 RepID=A0A1R3KY57_9ROSI|nr:hypothetical protein COLO4_03495 [Corchorus olitorius]
MAQARLGLCLQRAKTKLAWLFKWRHYYKT